MVFKKGHEFYGNKETIGKNFQKDGKVWNNGLKIKNNYPQMGFQKNHNINIGRKCSKETRVKIGNSNSVSLKGRKITEITKQKISKINKQKMKKITHHINGNHLDNRIENLMVMSQSEHIKLHHKQGDIFNK